VFIAEQSLFVRSALYLSSLLFLLIAGGLAVSRFIGALEAAFEELRTKQDILQLVAIAIYTGLLITMEPSIRALASGVGNVLVTSLIVAPLVGVTLRERLPERSGR
jgi:hypothetical protein